jgi:hypothetical protein
VFQAFASGDPTKAWEATSRLIEAYRNLNVEAATLRFKLNFGSERCQNCDGLRAGPGVLATCFQVQQCNFTNIKDGEMSPRHLRIVQTLLETPLKKT